MNYDHGNDSGDQAREDQRWRDEQADRSTSPEDPEGAEEEAVARDRARDAGTVRYEAAAGDGLTAWIAGQQEEET